MTRLEGVVDSKDRQISQLEETISLFDYQTGKRIEDGASADAGSMEARRLQWQRLFDQVQLRLRGAAC